MTLIYFIEYLNLSNNIHIMIDFMNYVVVHFLEGYEARSPVASSHPFTI